MSADAVLPCARCRRPAVHAGIGYRVRVEMMLVNRQRAQRQLGLEVMLGGHAGIAAAMGDRDVVDVAPYGEAQVCLQCLTDVALAEVMSAMEGAS